jgi:murein DD-endopeptidase MepM/ murein hydrolase activator NlpD
MFGVNNLRSIVFSIIFIFSISFFAHANSEVAELKNKISQSQSEIEKLESEIKKYERELNSVYKKKKTLKNALYSIELSRKKTINQIYLTGRKIKKLEKEIRELSGGIKEKEAKIGQNKKLLASMLRRLDEHESSTFTEVLLSQSFSDLLNDLENIKKLQELIKKENRELAEKKVQLKNNKDELEKSKKNLTAEKNKLNSQKRSLDIARREQKKLLSQTQNKESNYQEILAAKRKAKAEFEAQMREYESKLQYVLNPNALPTAGAGVLGNPLSKVYITQYFGNTKFAKSGAYNGKGHNGIDLRASIGTPVYAALSGKVIEVGNTDRYPGCYSYGKWILVRHGNGLSTLYAHLSDIAVSNGQTVTTGQTIGYSGNTGYSTGPHLHFTVYASDAVKVVRLGDIRRRTNCAKARIPVAPLNAYLNPLDYLR